MVCLVTGLSQLLAALSASMLAAARPPSSDPSSPSISDPPPFLRHPRLGPAPDLQQTLESFRELQADLSRSVLAIDRTDEDGHSLSYEIKPLSSGAATSPPPRPTSRWERPHRLRHHGRRHPRPGRDELGFRIAAAMESHELEAADGPASFARSLTPAFSGVLRPQKGCPTVDGRERLMCPSRSDSGYHVCIQMDELCNHLSDCPHGEDENPLNCLFYRTTMGHFKKVVDAVVSLTDHMVKAEEAHREL